MEALLCGISFPLLCGAVRSVPPSRASQWQRPIAVERPLWPFTHLLQLVRLEQLVRRASFRHEAEQPHAVHVARSLQPIESHRIASHRMRDQSQA